MPGVDVAEVHEGERVLVLVDARRGNLPRHQLAEDAVCHPSTPTDWYPGEGTCASHRSSSLSAVSGPPQMQPVSMPATRSVSCRPAVDQWPKTIWRSLPFRVWCQGRKPGGGVLPVV